MQRLIHPAAASRNGAYFQGRGWGGVDAMSAENAAVLIMHMSMYRPKTARKSRHDRLYLIILVLLSVVWNRERRESVL